MVAKRAGEQCCSGSFGLDAEVSNHKSMSLGSRALESPPNKIAALFKTFKLKLSKLKRHLCERFAGESEIQICCLTANVRKSFTVKLLRESVNESVWYTFTGLTTIYFLPWQFVGVFCWCFSLTHTSSETLLTGLKLGDLQEFLGSF